MVVEVGPDKKHSEKSEESVYDLPGYAPNNPEVTVSVESKKAGRKHVCYVVTTLLFLAMLGAIIFLGVALCKVKRTRFEPCMQDGLFEEDMMPESEYSNDRPPFSPDRPYIDYGNRPDSLTWQEVSSAIADCLQETEQIQAEDVVENVLDQNGAVEEEEETYLAFSDSWQLKQKCLENKIKENPRGLFKFIRNIIRPYRVVD